MRASGRLVEAVELTVRLHGDQRRKGSGAPYFFHPLTVAGIVADDGGGEDEVIAALLHDAVEDAGGEEIRLEIERRFGRTVAALVVACSDTDATPKPPWRPRKEAFVERMLSESPAVRRIVTADKIHNVRALIRELESCGSEVWSRFRGGREGSLWYYRAVTDALGAGWSHPLRDELERLVEELHRAARG